MTTRQKRFTPSFQIPNVIGLRDRIRWRRQVGEPFKPFFRVRLGRTRFAQLDSKNSDEFAGPHFKASPGARVYRYSEYHSYGNPGHYLTFVFTASTAGSGDAAWEHLMEVIEQAGYHEWPYPMRPDPDAFDSAPDKEQQPDWEDIPAEHKFRRHTAITTYTVIHPNLWAENFPTNFGPHGDEVRLLP